ncbi:MAG: TraR/DksA family transcriptional regulator [Sulfurimonas sp.]|uniref:TraR/DksA family transcriptional regulator n=1 Tax=Sulfurimonas sp. TaxID=2022749 RepID=UPI0028CBF908|nr:TraR/DksA family transcriptional regulator [Sulfurimonas sp.]MDT8337878.1 TraR/DksA family transcriptional regulator [Sulfurimonas sp.]
MQNEKLQYFKEKLESLKSEVEDSIASLKERTKPVSPDVSLGRLTRQEALQEQHVALENLRQTEIKLKKINSALNRIHNKTFGECIDCGDDIAKERLEIMPENGLCIECASVKR